MSVTIYEIAEQAGVSSSTVARILRGDDRSAYRRSARAAERVRRIAAELGYRPNQRAQERFPAAAPAASDCCTQTMPGSLRVSTRRWSTAWSDACRKSDTIWCSARWTSEAPWEDIVLGGQIDGGVVFQPLPLEVAKRVRERQLPLVLLGDDSDPTLSQVVVDDSAGAVCRDETLAGTRTRAA